MRNPTTDPARLRIGNCSGFYGDRFSAMREMLEGGELDVLTGDYLSELTMLILGKDKMRDPSLGYARTFLRQAEDCLRLAVEKGVRLISNAGGLNPSGLAERLRTVAAEQGLEVRIAHVEGDDLSPRAEELGLGTALTANAYLGAFGIAEALRGGADVVVTGRVTDASLVVGPAAAHFDWSPHDYDRLAGAMVAGHVIECGTQATGGNFSGFLSLGLGETPLGFPIAEIAADGSCVITKHPGTGGAVTLDTVTAQLLYEVQSPTYAGPDASARLDTAALTQDGPDRVAINGVRGEAPPETLKVCVNELGGFRNAVEFVLTGLQIEDKAAWVRAQMERFLAERPPAEVVWALAGTDREDADTQEAAGCLLRCAVKDPDADVVGRAFTSAAVELALASYPGFTMTAPPGPATAYGVYRAAYVPRAEIAQVVVHPDGSRVVVPDAFVAAGAGLPEGGGAANRPRSFVARLPDPSTAAPPPSVRPAASVAALSASDRHHRWLRSERSERLETTPSPVNGAAPPSGSPTPATADLTAPPADTLTRRMPLGTFVHARSGDKGGDANVGLWIDHATSTPERVAWLLKLITVDRIKELLPETHDLDIEVHPLPNLGGVNVVIHGLLGDGVAASTRFDPQAKALGEWIRSRLVSITEDLL